jgi:hypothetical protein
MLNFMHATCITADVRTQQQLSFAALLPAAASSAGTHARQHQAALQRAEIEKLFEAKAQRQKKHAADGITDDDLVQVGH